jgi:hypothetical protein
MKNFVFAPRGESSRYVTEKGGGTNDQNFHKNPKSVTAEMISSFNRHYFDKSGLEHFEKPEEPGFKCGRRE